MDGAATFPFAEIDLLKPPIAAEENGTRKELAFITCNGVSLSS